MRHLPILEKRALSRIEREKAFSLIAALILLVGTLAQVFLPSTAHAIAASAYVRLDRLATSATGGALVCMTPQTVNTVGKVVVTFPGNGTQGAASFGVNSTAANWTITTTGIPSGTTAWPSIATASTVSGASVTFPSGNLTTGTTYCFIINGSNVISNPTSTGSGSTLTGTIQTQTSGAVAIDTVTYAESIISNDQISVTASVPQSFTYVLGSNTAGLGTLTLGSAISATGITSTVTTNAQNGWQAWVKSANGALTSAGTGGSITSATADLSVASKGYGLQDSATAGNAIADVTTYGLTGQNVGALTTAFTSIGSYTGPSAVSGDQLTLVLKAKADSSVKAASDYADTLTITAAGKF